MKVIICSDMEGLCGVDTADMMIKGTPGYEQARVFLMDEVNAAVAGAFDGGADEVLVVDGHTGGGNFIMDMLDVRAKQIVQLDGETAKGVDAYMEVGCHAMAGAEHAFIDHTQCPDSWFEYTINGKPYGEIGQGAVWSGAHDVPFVMVSGDQAACKEAAELIPGIACAEVKCAKKYDLAESIPREDALHLIRQAACDGVRRADKITPHKIDLPAKLTLTYTRNDYCDKAANPNRARKGRTVTWQVDKIVDYLDIF